jgi:hypothetical protein
MEDLPFACVLNLGSDDAVLYGQIQANAPFAKTMIGAVPHTKRGKRLVICGAGPSLHGYLTERPRWFAHEVWATNSAVPFLMERGARVTHAVGVDQTDGMLRDWAHPYPALPYLVATSIHPALREHLVTAGCHLHWFHNYLGLKNPADWTPVDQCWWCAKPEAAHGPDHAFKPTTYELHLYRTLFQPAAWTMYGLNVVGRALCLALWLGYQQIHIWGSDCGAIAPSPMPAGNSPEYAKWMETIIMYADGRNAREVYTERGALLESPIMQGRQWITRADMVMTAQHLVTMAQWAKGRVKFMGDTMPGDILAEGPESFQGTRALPTSGDGVVMGMVLHPEHHVHAD